MKKSYRALFTLVFSITLFSARSQQIVLFSFTGSTGDDPTWPSSYEATGVQPSTLSRGPGVQPSATDDRFNSKNWTNSSSIDPNDYIEFDITPEAGYSITLSTIAMQFQRSTNAPRNFVIRTSLDGFAADATNVVSRTDVNTTQTSTFTFLSPITTTSSITIRIYAYNAVNASSTWGPGLSTDGNDLSVSGTMVALPVKFANVKAAYKDNRVDIRWTNLTESDLLYYVVEWSADGLHFTELDRLSPLKNEGSRVDYVYENSRSLDKVTFFRIKAVETGGHTLYSQTMRLETGKTTAALAVYPNPVSEGSQVAIQLNRVPAGRYIVNIYTASAQLIYSQVTTINSTSFTQTLPLSHWQKGLYILELSGAVNLKKQLIVQ